MTETRVPTTHVEAAELMFEWLKKYATDRGYAESEVFYRPSDADHGGFPHVFFEAGPFEWAVSVSLGGGMDVPGDFPTELARGAWGYTEPYYSFDLVFYPA